VLLLALALALLIGVVLGLLGGGGSILTLPMLVYVVGMPPREAITTSLLVVAATSLGGLLGHARGGRVRWSTGLVFGLAGMLGAYAGGRLSGFLPERGLLLGFAALMVASATAMLRKKPPPPQAAEPGGRKPARVALIGLGVGSITGMVGAGGGFVIVPSLALLCGLSMPEAVGTSALVLAMQSSAGFAGHLGHATLDWALAGGLATASVAGSLAGARLSGRAKPDQLRKGFAWFVLAIAAAMVVAELGR
jgi:uncharacterized membrane protein YfcA